MSKVIIITRDGEYNSKQVFSDAIKGMDTCVYNTKNKVIDYCKTKRAEIKWEYTNNLHKDTNGDVDTEKVLQDLNFDNTEINEYFNKALQGEDDAKKWAIGILKNKMSATMTNPYAAIPTSASPKHEVILVLPGKLQIDKDEAIPDFIEFMNWVKEDCSIEGGDNILYIHDTQLYGTEIEDTTVYDRVNGIDLTEEESSLYKKLNLSALKDTYNFIAIFKHLSNQTSYFQSHILSMRFGQPNLIDELGKTDSTKSWQERIKETNEAVKKYKGEIVRKEGIADENV